MPDDNTPAPNCAPQPPRPRRTKLLLAGAAAGAIVVGAGINIPASQPVRFEGVRTTGHLGWSSTAPATHPAESQPTADQTVVQPSRAVTSVRLGMPARVVVFWTTTSPASAPSTQKSAASCPEETLPEKR
jgi:hypothetical protein